jgi:hypothetical protein
MKEVDLESFFYIVKLIAGLLFGLLLYKVTSRPIVLKSLNDESKSLRDSDRSNTIGK